MSPILNFPSRAELARAREVVAVTGDEGARSVIRAHAAAVARVVVSDGQAPGDVDTEEDYAALLAAWPPD